MRGRLRAMIAALVTAAVLSACAGLPTGDGVQPGGPVLGQDRQGVPVLPLAPDQGADPVQIVNGFIRANVGFQDDHAVAREYLTPALGQNWRPTSQVVIYQGSMSTSELDRGTVEVRLTVAATLDSAGQLTEVPAETEQRHRFKMELVEGQWRISEFPSDYGLFLNVNDFRRNYQLRPITYIAADSQEYISDPRWFPAGDGQVTALARAQVQPVPEHLRGAVRSGFTAGTELAAAGVPVDPGTGVATVDLTGGETPTDEQARMMWIQMARTLTSAGVSQVRLQRGGHLVSATGIEDTLGDPSSLGYRVSSAPVRYALLRVFDQLEFVDASHYGLTSYQPRSDEDLPALPAIEMRWVDLAAATGARELAALSFDRTQLARWRDGDAYVHTGIGTELTGPSYDQAGGLWVAGVHGGDTTTAQPRIWWMDTARGLTGNVARNVRVEWLEPDWRIGHLKVSPDETTVALHVIDPATEEQTLWLTAVVRDEDGVPVTLTQPRRIAPTITELNDLDWANAGELFLLGRRAQDSQDLPMRLPLGDWLVEMPAVELASAIRAWETPQGIEVAVVRNARGNIFSQEGQNRWESYRNGDDLVVPGH